MNILVIVSELCVKLLWICNINIHSRERTLRDILGGSDGVTTHVHAPSLKGSLSIDVPLALLHQSTNAFIVAHVPIYL